MIICLISMSVDGHVGTKAQAAFSLLGETWVGSTLAGLMVSSGKQTARGVGSNCLGRNVC